MIINLLLALLGFAMLYQLSTLTLVWRFRRFEMDPPVDLLFTPGVSHLKTISGVQPRTETNLRSFLEQDYPGPVEVVFSAGRLGDPALEVARRIQSTDSRVKVVEGDASSLGTNPKVASMIQAYPHCTQPVILSTDSDMHAPPRYMAKMMAPFHDPTVGMVTCLYCIQRVKNPSMALEAMSVLDFSTSVLVARALEGMSFGLGANMAMRREGLEGIGAFTGVGEYLAEDYQLGNRLHRAGWKVVLAGTVVEDVLPGMKFWEYFRHQLRWMRTYRVSRAKGHFSYIVTQGTAWVLGLLALCGPTPRVLGLAAAWFALRSFCATRCWKLLGGVDVGRYAWLVPFKDLVYLVLWVLSVRGDTVRWGPRLLKLHPDGTMTLIRRYD